MSTQTTNLNLVKPGDNDALDIADINDNMDTLDAAVGAVDPSTDGSLQEQINDLGESVSQKADVIGGLIAGRLYYYENGGNKYVQVVWDKSDTLRYFMQFNITSGLLAFYKTENGTTTNIKSFS